MSEILIKGMKMPKGCNECRFHDGSWCHAQPIENWRDSYYRPSEGEKQPTCPLVEVPPHGRLIDEADLRDCAYKRQIRDRISFNDALVLALMDAPTVIEASKERE